MERDLWFKNAIIYSLDLETFQDSDGDGVGDFAGLMRRLDYLETLGVDAIWVAPFQKTPNRDNGYDISDYYAVDPRHGTAGEMVEFVHEAKRRGLRVLMDLVVNHTSDEHPWFKEARKGPGSPHHDWYIWSKKRPADWNKGMVFPGHQKTTWTRDGKSGLYYYHRFYDFQPDLNMDNPEVRAEIRRIIGFWLDLGMDGFRVDAVPFILEPSKRGARGKQKLRFDYLDELRSFLQWRRGDAVFLGEANVTPDEMKPYFAGGRGIHMMFNFWVNQHLFYALASAEVEPLVEALRATRDIPREAQWAQFLRNHDELDLGRLTDAQRALVFETFGPEKRMQIYGRGIRRRVAPMLGDRANEELAYSMMFALPGTPVIRYGDEIAMGDDLSLDERAAVRTPMQWSAEPNAGFSSAKKLIHPVISDGVYDYRNRNVEEQKRDPGSFLHWMMRMIRVRKECPEIGLGSWEIVKTRAPGVVAMQYEAEGNLVVTVHNFAHRAREVRLRLPDASGRRLVDLLARDDIAPDDRGVYRIPMEAHGYRWFRAGGLFAPVGVRHDRPT